MIINFSRTVHPTWLFKLHVYSVHKSSFYLKTFWCELKSLKKGVVRHFLIILVTTIETVISNIGCCVSMAIWSDAGSVRHIDTASVNAWSIVELSICLGFSICLSIPLEQSSAIERRIDSLIDTNFKKLDGWVVKNFKKLQTFKY